MQNMGPSEIGVFAASMLIIFKLLLEFLTKIFPKGKVFSDSDIRDMEYKTNLKGVLDECRKILEKMDNRGEKRDMRLTDIQRTGENSHKRIGTIESHVEVLAREILTK